MSHKSRCGSALYYYLVRGSEPTCDESPSYRTFAPAENPGNPSKRDAEITACPAP